MTRGDLPTAAVSALRFIRRSIRLWPGRAYENVPGNAMSGKARQAIIRSLFFVVVCCVTAPKAAWGEEPWVYRLLEGSYLIDDCLICERPTILEPMRGTFLLAASSGSSNEYRLNEISFTAGRDSNRTYQVQGEGTYLRRVNPTNYQEVVLRTTLNGKNKVFTNVPGAVERSWPIIEFDAEQTDFNLIEFYRLHIRAAPLREVWFSTASNFSIIRGSETNVITAGDLISSSGRVVRSNYGLLARLGVLPFVRGDFGLDAAEVVDGGEVLFSLGEDAYSETLGKFLREGDLLSTRGTVVATNQGLLAGFTSSAAVTNAGLDAVGAGEQNEFLISIRTNFFSEVLGRTISRGDLLSTRGRVVRSQSQLLAKFHPSDAKIEPGLDAFFVWPSGEVWFSTETAFLDNGLGPIQPGDLLSEEGYIVFRNKDLLERFPMETREADLGLDSLILISDALPSGGGKALLSIGFTGHDGDLKVSWEGGGRVFQVQSATKPEGPYEILSPIDVDDFFLDTETGKGRTNRFYRVRQW